MAIPGRRRGVSASQLFAWRKRYRPETGRPVPASRVPGFAAVAIAPPPVPIASDVTPAGLIEIELPDGGRVRIAGPADPAVVAAALRALAGR